MSPEPRDRLSLTSPKFKLPGAFDWLFLFSSAVALGLALQGVPLELFWGRSSQLSESYPLAPLVMKGGDPYIRALMRTISASESNSSQPYAVLYGGEQVEDLSQHPDRCVPIVIGPNVGDCTTAAGRYQFITTTWLEKARQYHPHPYHLIFWTSYSFEPEFQDQVVYRWLNDPQAWGTDLSQLLRQGEIKEVLYLLSPVWTSLGYGIESNSMTDALPEIYDQMLQEELDASSP